MSGGASDALRICKHGEKVLRQPCPHLNFSAIKDELPALLKAMWATMYGVRGVGLAAPQIGRSLRLAIVDVRPEGRPQRLVLINPEIIAREGVINDEEGCLSLPGLYAKVERAAKVRVRARDQRGEFFELDAEGLLARAFQHETDHLDGKLFIDHLDFARRLKVMDAMKELKKSWT